MRIEYARCAYVSEIGADMLDRIDRHCFYSATKEDCTVMDFEEVIAWGDPIPDDREEMDEDQLKLHEFMQTIYEQLKGEIGDVFFFA